jgi:hypothetical protein
MICGINPYVISSIRMRRAVRSGAHPAWLNLMRKRNPIRASFGLYVRDIFDGYCPAVS